MLAIGGGRFKVSFRLFLARPTLAKQKCGRNDNFSLMILANDNDAIFNQTNL